MPRGVGAGLGGNLAMIRATDREAP